MNQRVKVPLLSEEERTILHLIICFLYFQKSRIPIIQWDTIVGRSNPTT